MPCTSRVCTRLSRRGCGGWRSSLARASRPATIAELEQPDLAAELDATGHRVRALREWLRSETSRLAAPNVSSASPRNCRRRIAARGLQERQARLTLRAPHAGRVAALADGLLPGVLSPRQTLAQIIDPAAARIEALVPEDRLTTVASAVADGAAARFHPDTRAPGARRARAASPGRQPHARCAAAACLRYGGPLAATRDAHGRLLPQTPVYRLDLQPAAGAAAPSAGCAARWCFEVEAEPLLTQVWRRIAAVLIRESGFELAGARRRWRMRLNRTLTRTCPELRHARWRRHELAGLESRHDPQPRRPAGGRSPASLMLALEPRLMFDAAAPSSAADTLSHADPAGEAAVAAVEAARASDSPAAAGTASDSAAVAGTATVATAAPAPTADTGTAAPALLAAIASDSLQTTAVDAAVASAPAGQRH